MSNNIVTLIGALGTLVTVIVAMIQLAQSSFGQRYRIRRDLDIVRDLPVGETRDRLAASVEESVRVLLDREERRRPLPPQQVVLMTGYLFAAIVSFLAGVVSGHSLFYIGGATFLIGDAYGLISHQLGMPLRWEKTASRQSK